MHEQPKKKLKVDLSTLEAALDNHEDDVHFYLDLETGSIPLITDDLRLEFQDFLDDVPVDKNNKEALLQALKAAENTDLIEVVEIDTDTSGRYLEIVSEDRRSGYHAMEAFIGTLEDRALQNHLSNSIHGKGAFRNFKNTLSRYPKELDLWNAFRNNLAREEALRWLDQHGIEPIL